MLTKILQRIAAALLCALVLVYIVIQISSALSKEIVTEHAGMNSIEEKVEVTGYILRNESLLMASQPGVFHRSVEEGDKVAKKELVATVYASDTASQVQADIAKINQKLSILQASVVDTNYATNDVSKEDNTIYSLINSTHADIIKGKYNLAVQNRSDLLTSLNKRQLIVGSVTDFSAKIDALNAEKNALTSSLTDIRESVYAQNSGYFSGLVDGYESIFTMDALNNLTVDSFQSLLQQQQGAVNELTVGKLIQDFTWYLLCPIDRAYAASFEQGSTYKLSFPYSSDIRINAKLNRKVMQTNSDTVVLVFSANEIPVEFNFTRSQTVQIILKSYTGLQIVKSALRQIDGVEGVYILSGGTIHYKKVDRIYENEGYYLVKIKDSTDPDSSQYLELYDAVIIRGKDLYEGKVVT